MGTQTPGHRERPNRQSWGSSAASAVIFGVGTGTLVVTGFPAGIVAICAVIAVLSAVQAVYRRRVGQGGDRPPIPSSPAAMLVDRKVVWTPVAGTEDRYVAEVDGTQWSLHIETSDQDVHYVLERGGRAVYEAAALPVRWRLLEFPNP